MNWTNGKDGEVIAVRAEAPRITLEDLHNAKTHDELFILAWIWDIQETLEALEMEADDGVD